nr:2-hydroxyacyl-CoA dehydratase family protein [Candidatus Sigynarchaeota archaeon]
MESIISTPKDEPFPYKAYFLEKKEDGKKFVGLFAHEMVPVELIRASGVHVVPLVFVGPEEYSSTGGSFITHSACSFARNIVGGFIHGDISFYKYIESIIRTNYCNGDFIGMEYLCREYNMPCIDLSIPMKTQGYSLAFFHEQLKRFKQKLEDVLAAPIDEAEIRRQISIHNNLRQVLRRLLDLGIRGAELLHRYQEAAVLEPAEMIARLDCLYFQEAAQHSPPSSSSSSNPRIMLSGDPIFINDFFGDWLEEFGATIVYYDTWIGGRMAEFSIDEVDPDVYHALAKGYLMEQGLERSVPAAMEKRIKRVSSKVGTQKIDGIINHTLKFCDFQAIGRTEFKDRLGQHVPVLDIERDYAQSNLGNIKTRVEAFIELVKGGA